MQNEDAHKRLFYDRRDAALQLVQDLREYSDHNTLVLGIPRGGAEIGYHISKGLFCRFSVIISKKLPHPLQPEFGFGAVCEEGGIHISEEVPVENSVRDHIITQLEEEIIRRVILYRKGRSLPDMQGRTVILADDGLATGVTLIPAIRLCKKKGAARVIVAVPVSPSEYPPEIAEANEVVILHRVQNFRGVGQAYEKFPQLTDEQVLFFVEAAG